MENNGTTASDPHTEEDLAIAAIAVATQIVEGAGQTLGEWTIIIDRAFDAQGVLLGQLTSRCPHIQILLLHACFIRIGF